MTGPKSQKEKKKKKERKEEKHSGVAQVVEHLSSNPSTAKKEKKKKYIYIYIYTHSISSKEIGSSAQLLQLLKKKKAIFAFFLVARGIIE
jgi:hypothetical protein